MKWFTYYCKLLSYARKCLLMASSQSLREASSSPLFTLCFKRKMHVNLTLNWAEPNEP